MSAVEQDEERIKAHRALLGKITAWSGWILALTSILLGSHLLTRLAGRVAELERENKILRAQATSANPAPENLEQP